MGSKCFWSEMGSGSLSDSGGSSASSLPNLSPESLNGLKFGKKIYFEDVGVGGLPKSGGRSSSSSVTPPKKVRGGVVHASQPPRCQVEGCKVDLSDAKAYYSRHKVCGMHSKCPKVIVAGLEQRFCQQCSRFHLLPEFDQGKRSCRRRLAGHNERRRKPPAGSLLSSRYGGFSSSIFAENNGRTGSFLMDFTAHPKLTGRDAWTTPRFSERTAGNQPNAAMGRFLPHPWQGNSESSSSNLFLQSTVSGTSLPGPPGIPSGECVTGVTDSACALSLLSNQTWCSRNQTSGLAVSSLMNAEGAPPVAHATAQGAADGHFPVTSWGFKGREAAGGSHDMATDLGLSQISQPLTMPFSIDIQLPPQGGGRQYMELGQARAFDSSIQQIHWSL